jgi:hypothetical protein
MSCAELYDRVLAALHEDEGSFNAAARNWIEGAEDAPFEDAEARELFANAKHYCTIWRSGAINARISKRRMIDCVRKIAEKDLWNPYKDIEAGFRMLGVVPGETKLVDEPEAIQGTTLPKEAVDAFAETPLVNAVNAEEIEKAVKKTEHVLGVVPEEKPGLFKRKKR